MDKLAYYLIGILFFSLLTSCTEERDYSYHGLNKVYLTVDGDPVLSEVGDEKVTVRVDLTIPTEKDVVLQFNLVNDTKGVLKIENNPVTVKAGERTATVLVSSNKKEILNQDTYFEIGMTPLPEERILLNEGVKIRVKPSPKIPPLTDEQKALIEGYKQKFGFDLNEWLGLIKVHTMIQSPENGSTAPFVKAFTKEVDGKTIITLSELSTTDMPVLKMIDNPMGLTEYCNWVLRQETVENYENWYGENANPNYAQIMSLLTWNKESEETFQMAFDELKLTNCKKEEAGIDFVKETQEGDDTKSWLPITFFFTPWERQLKLIKEGNQTAVDLEDADGTANPAYYLMLSNVKSDDFGETNNFIDPLGKISFKDGKMTFQFVIDHSSAGGYSRVYVEYTK